MKNRNPYLASLLSIPVPGLGQIYAGESTRGALILSFTIIVGNLNAIFLSIYATAKQSTDLFWVVMLPRLLHELLAIYGIIFLVWQVADAFLQAKKTAS
jgi:TM2 domain-containing membrane protein YozV